MFAVAAFGITAVSIGSYIIILRARLQAAETDAGSGSPSSEGSD